jgi:hypothetical protein
LKKVYSHAAVSATVLAGLSDCTQPVGVRPQRLQPAVEGVGPGAAEIAGEEIEELLQVAVQRGVATLLDPELDADGHGPGGEDHVDGAFHVGHRHVGVGHPLGDGDPGEGGGDFGEAVGVLGQPGGGVAVALDDHGDDGRQQEGVGARPQR